MSDIKIQQLESFLGNIDKIVFALGINELPEESQLKIIERFSDILFKRILLRVPKEHTEEVKQVFLDDKNGGAEKLAETLRGVIPNIDDCIKEEFENTVVDFKK